jgi:ribosomal protein L11 methyltransferase
MRALAPRCAAMLRRAVVPSRAAQPPPCALRRPAPRRALRVATAASSGGVEPSPSASLLRVRLLGVAGADVDPLSDVLLGCGALSVSVEDASAGTASEVALYRENGDATWTACHVAALFTDASAWADARDAASLALNGRDLSDSAPGVAFEEALDADWEAAIRDSYQPTQLLDAATGPQGRALWIVPDWVASPPDPDAINLVLEPGLAFGTGEHPTTRLCLAWLAKAVQGGERVMDYGAGSGVLAVCALSLGAASAVATDVDALAVGAAVSNGALNGFGGDRLASVQVAPSLAEAAPSIPLAACSGGDGLGGGCFEIVVANILLGPLLDLAPRLAYYAAPGGRLALSGLLAVQAAQVTQAYSPYFDGLRVTTEGEWALLEGTRNTAPQPKPTA